MGWSGRAAPSTSWRNSARSRHDGAERRITWMVMVPNAEEVRRLGILCQSVDQKTIGRQVVVWPTRLWNPPFCPQLLWTVSYRAPASTQAGIGTAYPPSSDRKLSMASPTAL